MATLVTGGTGFTGAEVLRILAERGERDLFAFDIDPSTRRLDDVADRVEVVRGDVGNWSQVLNVVKKARPKVIYHLGGMLSVPSDAEPGAALQANAVGTFNVLEAARLFEAERVIFSSTIGTYGLDIHDATIDDDTLQRPQLFYGATKVFGELMGRFFQRKYGLDFRGVRYPVLVGPGVKTPGVAQFAAWVIEECAKGNPFTVWVKPQTRVPILYFKDAARAVVRLADAPRADIVTVVYVLAGLKPPSSAGELVELVRAKVPGAKVDFEPDPELQPILDKTLRPIDDARAEAEWGWSPAFGLEPMVDDFLRELEEHPHRYA